MLFKQWYDRMCGTDDVSGMPLPKCFVHVCMDVCICTPITRTFDAAKIVNTWKLEILRAEKQLWFSFMVTHQPVHSHTIHTSPWCQSVCGHIQLITFPYCKTFFYLKKTQENKQKLHKQPHLSLHSLFLKRKEVKKTTDDKLLFSSFTYIQIKISHSWSCHPHLLALLQQLFTHVCVRVYKALRVSLASQ